MYNKLRLISVAKINKISEYWLTDWLIDWLSNWLNDWRIDLLIENY